MLYTEIVSPVGRLTLAGEGDSLTGLWIRNQKYYPVLTGEPVPVRALPVFLRAAELLEAYFAGERPVFDLPLAPVGSDFRQSVWALLREIPYGRTVTYGALARELERRRGRHASAQAVGGAVGHNPISILIPCHRVIGADGGLTGYAGGLEVKRRLLELESRSP